MTSPQIYIAIAVIILAIIALFLFLTNKNKKEKKLTPMASYAFVFVLAGIIFGDNKSLGYSLMGIGVILAIIDMINTYKKSAKK
jgi:hypothetical protein